MATAIAVDKALISHWCSGVIKPSAFNLARLSQFIADRRPGFSLLDWKDSIAVLAAALGVKAPVATSATAFGVTNLLFLHEAQAAGRIDGGSYEGFWRVTRPSSKVPGQFAAPRCR